MIEGLRALGKTVFLTTHYMDEAEHLADRVAILCEGRIVAQGPMSELGASLGRRTVIGFRLNGELSAEDVRARVSARSSWPARRSASRPSDPSRRTRGRERAPHRAGPDARGDRRRPAHAAYACLHLLLPLVFLVLFNSIFIKGGDQTVTLPTGLKLSAGCGARRCPPGPSSRHRYCAPPRRRC